MLATTSAPTGPFLSAVPLPPTRSGRRHALAGRRWSDGTRRLPSFRSRSCYFAAIPSGESPVGRRRRPPLFGQGASLLSRPCDARFIPSPAWPATVAEPVGNKLLSL